MWPCPGTVNCKNCKIRGKESINERKRHRKKFRWHFVFNSPQGAFNPWSEKVKCARIIVLGGIGSLG